MRADASALPTLNPQCHREYPTTCCWYSGQSPVWGPSASASRAARRSRCATWCGRRTVEGCHRCGTGLPTQIESCGLWRRLAACQPCSHRSEWSHGETWCPSKRHPRVGVQVAHPPSRHGPAPVASSGRGDLLVLGAGHGESYLDTVLGQGAELGNPAACLELPREPLIVHPWTMSLHLPTVTARLLVVDVKVRPLEGEPGVRLSHGIEGKRVLHSTCAMVAP